MLLKTSILSIILLTTQINQSLQHKTCENGLACVNNKLIQVELLADHLTYQVSEIDSTKFRDDYTHAPGIGWYKLHIQAKTWNEARKICEAEGAHLTIINSKEEEKVILKLLNKEMKFITNSTRPDVIWLGGHNWFGIDDWVTLFGESLHATGFVNWSKGCSGVGLQPNNNGGDEYCLTLNDSKCEEGWHDWACYVHFAFVCENPNFCT